MTDIHILPLANAINLRTLAGYETKDGHRIKANKLLRSGLIADISQKDADKLANDYGLIAVVDLRMNEEIECHQDILSPSVAYYQMPVLPFTDYVSFVQRLRRYFTKAENPMVELYKKMLTDSHANTAYRGLFDLLLRNSVPGASVLFHCTTGKDRTGVAAMLIEAALGVPEATIRKDYLLTNEVLSTIRGFTGSDNDLLETETTNIHLARNVNVQAVFDVIHLEYGNWTTYLEQQLNLTTQERTTLRKIYLE